MIRFAIALLLGALVIPAQAEEQPLSQYTAAPAWAKTAAAGAARAVPPSITGSGILWTSSSANLSITIPSSTSVLVIAADGRKLRGDKELKDLPREELLTVIDELIDLIKRK